MAGNSPGYLRQHYARSARIHSGPRVTAAPGSCGVAPDRNALHHDLPTSSGKLTDLRPCVPSLHRTCSLASLNCVRWTHCFLRFVVVVLLAVASDRDHPESGTEPDKDLGRSTQALANWRSVSQAESVFLQWGSYTTLQSVSFSGIGVAFASPQGEASSKTKVTERDLAVPVNLEVSKRIAFPDPIFGQVTFQCPPGYDLLFNQCQKKVIRPPMPSCPYGSYMNEDGNCISVDSVPAERTCSAGYQPYEKGCVRRDLIQAIPFCSKPAFQLFQRGPEAECVQLMEKDPLFSCHEGVLEDGLCIIRTQEEPAVSCSLGFDLVAQDLRPPQCERVVFVDPEPLCEDGWDLSPHPETGENSCVSIRKTPPVAVCPEEGDYTLVDGECLRVELTEPEPMCPPGFVFNRWDAMCRRVKAQGAVPVCREGWRYVEETGKCTIEEEPTYICEAEDSRTRKQGFGEVPQSGVEPLEVPMKLFPSTSTGRHEWDSTEGATGVINFECATVEIAEPRMGCAAGELLLMQDRADPDTTVVGNDFTEKAFFLGEEGSSSLLTADSDQGSPPPYTQKSRLHQKKVPGEAGSSSVNPGSGRLKMVQLRRGGASASGIAVGHAHDSRESLKLTNKSVSATEATSNPQEKKRRNPVNGPMLKLSSKAGGKEDEPDAQDRRTDTAFTESNASPARGAHKWIESRRLSAKAGDVSRMNEVLSPMTNSRRLSSLDSGFRSVEGDSVCRITFATKPTLMPAACPVQVAAGAWNSKGKENLDGECVEVHVQRPKLRCPSGEILDDTFVTPRCEQVEIEPPTMLCPDGSSPVDGGRCIRLHSQPPLALCEEHYEVQASTGRCVRAFNEPPGWTCPTGYRLPETELPAQSAKEIVAPHLGSRKGDTASPVIIGPPLPPVQAGFCERVEFSSVQFVCPVGFGRVKDKKTKEWVCIADKAVPSTLLCESGFFLEDGLCVMHLRMAPSLVDQDGRPFPCVTRPDGTNSCGHAAPYQVALGTDDTAKHSRTGSKK